MYKESYSKLCDYGICNKDAYCKGSDLHKHHIIPTHMGGSSSEENYTYLTVKQHILAHWLLWKIHNNVNDLRAMKLLGANLSHKKRKRIGEYCRDNRIGFFNVDSEIRKEWSRKGAKTCMKRNTGIHTKDKELRSKWAADAGRVSIEARKSRGENAFIMTEEQRKNSASLGGKALRGFKVMHHPNINNGRWTRVNPQQVDQYIQMGYVLGYGPVPPKKRTTTVCREVIIDNITYSSAKHAANILGLSQNQIAGRCRSQTHTNYNWGEKKHLKLSS